MVYIHTLNAHKHSGLVSSKPVVRYSADSRPDYVLMLCTQKCHHIFHLLCMAQTLRNLKEHNLSEIIPGCMLVF